MSDELKNLVERKKELGKERDLCAELYNLWITKMHDYQNDPIKYKLYRGLIENMEPYAKGTKEEIREINRKICSILGVDTISETDYEAFCSSKYGLESPNA